MKQLTFSAMAAARLRANKRQYISLALGIFLSIFLVSTLVLAVYSIYGGFLQQRYERIGYIDAVVLDDKAAAGELEDSGLFGQMGHVHLTGAVTDHNVYLGFYDNVGQKLMNLQPIQGRLPRQAGEVAAERSALEILGLTCGIGETMELEITPIDGAPERRSFTLVGILPERAAHFERTDYYRGIYRFPGLVVSEREPVFSVGRIATHHLLTMAPGVGLDRAIRFAWDNHIFEDMYGLSLTGQAMQTYSLGELLRTDKEMFDLILMVGLLAAALLLSCGVGISGAMEGVLIKRQEEIGILRAIGATRKQIRRIFGRENLILALVLSPVSVALSCLAVWIMCQLLPETMAFGFRLWLLLPVGVFSVAVILLSGSLSLVRVSKGMPMGALRDTGMLRRAKGLRSRRAFSPMGLISARQLRFWPTRQIEASLLVGLMLLCGGLFTGVMQAYRGYAVGDQPGFYLYATQGHQTVDMTNLYLYPSLDAQSIRQIEGLSHVRNVRLDRDMKVLAVLDKVPRYVYGESYGTNSLGMLNAEAFEEYKSIMGEQFVSQDMYEESRNAYLRFLKENSIDGQAYGIRLVTMEPETIQTLAASVSSGRIDMGAIREGRQVIVSAPEVWMEGNPDGTRSFWPSEEAARNHPNGQDAVKLAWNDAFEAGQTLPLLHVYQDGIEASPVREDVTVTVGAVVGQVETGMGSIACIITTEQGLENMGLRMEGLERVRVYLDGELTQEEERNLERQLTAIARRTEGCAVVNYLEDYRQQQQANRRQTLLIAGLMVLFFSVSVSMIVSTVTRRMNTQGRAIGMLRAVGADERAILGCYGGQITVSIAGGLVLALGLFGIYFANDCLRSLRSGYYSPTEATLFASMVAVICTAAAVCYVVCRFFLRLRVRQIVKKSIIENIREL